ncbi:hypothetical protein [Acidisphaera sp. L21]|jgi:hypothetical protein|uniref:hypothetical protein n=1 Tax=Acidisphaera sp. L21 TaxID=1641851 RepID=UPI00131D3C9B|nr:hypothetical protein [Acidisphaera sp. L21]
MRLTGRAALVAAAGCLLAGGVAMAQTTAPDPALKAGPRQTTLTVVDRLGTTQQEETIAVYFSGVLAGTLHVDAAHPEDSFTVAVPLMPKLGFTLCGKLVTREANGGLSTHPIDNGGTLAGYDSSILAALTLGDVLFTLQDETGTGTNDVQQGPACTAAIS